jgi:tetratricopeptide (TPR) repeat protein
METFMTSLAHLEAAHPPLRDAYHAEILKRATDICLQRLAADPDRPFLLFVRALLASKAGDDDLALRCLTRAVARDPAVATYLVSLGDLLDRCGRRGDAEKVYLEALRVAPNDPMLSGRLDRLLRKHVCATDAAVTQPDSAAWHIRAAETMLRDGSLTETLASLRSALLEEPRNPQACKQFICVLELLGRSTELPGAWFSLGAALETHGRSREAIVAYRETLRRKPDHLKAQLACGFVYLHLGQPREAMVHFEAALQLEPAHSEAHRGLGWAAALVCDLTRTWNEIAWYDRHGPYQQRYFEQPAWEGGSLEGKTILLWTNAGLGDTVQMVRFAQIPKAFGASVIVECDKTLLPLVRGMQSVDEAVARRTPLPPFDMHALLAAIPRIDRTTLASIPSRVPYLFVAASLVEHWRKHLRHADEKLIGLVWSGEPTRADAKMKSAPLAAFAPLASVAGNRLISLQLGAPAADVFTPPAGLQVDRVLTDSMTAADTAAVMLNLDIIITVDTLTAHLAGALGRPVWTVLPYLPAWMWQGAGDISPWYPTMRLFRQREPGQWQGVIERVRAALEAL